MMSGGSGEPELAAAFQEQTDRLAALDRKLSWLGRERQRLVSKFDIIIVELDRRLDRGDAPLGLLSNLEQTAADITRIEQEIVDVVAVATERLSNPEPI